MTTPNYKFKSYGDVLEIHIPEYLSYLIDFLDYKIRSNVKNARLASSGGSGNKSPIKRTVSIDYKWLDKNDKDKIRKVTKEFFGNYIKKYNSKFKSWD